MTDLTNQIMSFVDYTKIRHDIPYIFEINAHDKKLVYFGSDHTKDPSNPMFDQIEEKFKQLTPQIVFIEGRRQLTQRKSETIEYIKTKNRADVIKEGGEPFFTLKLATEAGIEFESLEPELCDEVKLLLEKGFDKNDIFATYVYRGMSGYVQPAGGDTFEKYLDRWINYFKTATNWDEFDYSRNNLERTGKNIWGDNVKLSDLVQDRFDPVFSKNKTVSNKIIEQSSIFRDKFIVKKITEAIDKYTRILVVYGASHAVMQESAIRSSMH